MSDARCAHCKFWNRNGDAHWRYYASTEEEAPMPHRKCFRVIHGNGDETHGLTKPEAEAVPAMVRDGSGYAASLWTLPTFGCSAFEPVAKGEGASDE